MSLKKFYLEIWNERDHVSELSGKALLPINHAQWHWQFLHVLNKGRFPSMKYNKRNILLALPEEHEHQDRFSKFEERKIELLKEIYD